MPRIEINGVGRGRSCETVNVRDQPGEVAKAKAEGEDLDLLFHDMLTTQPNTQAGEGGYVLGCP